MCSFLGKRAGFKKGEWIIFLVKLMLTPCWIAPICLCQPFTKALTLQNLIPLKKEINLKIHYKLNIFCSVSFYCVMI